MPIPSLLHRLVPMALATALMTLGGCTTGPKVQADHDRSADFSRYKTFGFFNPLGTDRGGYQTLVSHYLVASTRRQLEARGLILDNLAPQLRVNFSAQLHEKQRITTSPGPSMGLGYYGYRAGFYSAWPLYRDQTLVTPYNEGTLNIDLIDLARQQMVWEGVLTSSVTDKDTTNLALAIDDVVSAAFNLFPIARPAATPAR